MKREVASLAAIWMTADLGVSAAGTGTTGASAAKATSAAKETARVNVFFAMSP